MRVLALLLLLVLPSFAANRYWVGAAAGCDGTWADTDCWSATSNGAGAAGVPTNADDVFFDGVGNGASNATLGASITINSLDMTGYANTLTHNASVTLTHDSSGVFKLSSGMTYTLGNAGTSALSFTSTSGTTLLTTAGKTVGNVTFNGAGGTWQFQDSFTQNTGSGSIALTAGTLDTNSQTVTTAFVNTGTTATRTLTMGSSAITAAFGWTGSTATGLTVTANTAVVTITSANQTFTTGGGTINWNGLSVVFSSSGGATINASGSTFANVTRTGTAVKTDTFVISSDFTVTGALTVNGNSSINRVLVNSNTLGTARTITAATVTITNADFRDITGAGAGSWDLSAITGLSGDAGGNSGITFTTPQTQYWVGATGNWSTAAEWGTSSGGSGGRVPLPQDDVVFDNGSFNGTSQTATMDMPRAGKSIDWSGYNEGQSPTWSKSTASSIYGSVALVSGVANTGTAAITMEGRSSYTWTSAGLTFTNPLTMSMFTGTLTLQDTLTSSSSITHANGTFDANNFGVTCTAFTSNSGLSRTLTMGSGTWTVNSTGAVWTLTTTGLTFTANTSTIVVSNTSATAKTFAGGGATAYNNITFSGDNITVSGANTFATMAVNNAGLTNGLKLTSGVTQTVTGFTTNGSAGNLAKLLSTTGASAATISKSSGSVAVDYMSIQDSTVTGGATWCAGANSTNVSGNTGWTFSACGGSVFPAAILNNPLVSQ